MHPVTRPLVIRSFALPLLFCFGSLSACGGGTSATEQDDGFLLPPAEDALDLQLPGGAMQSASEVEFELSWAGLEADPDTLVVELNGSPQPGPFDFSAESVRGVVSVDAPGDYALFTRIDVRTPGQLDYTELEASAEFEVVVMAPSLPEFAFELYSSFAGDGPFHDLGKAFARIEDLDADGVDDLVLASPGASPTGPKSGLVELRSGATGEVIRSFSGNDQSGFGSILLVFPDRDGDGLDDLLIGSPSDSILFEEGGGVAVYSSATGAELFGYFGEGDRERMGASLALIGDVNGDGTADFAAGGPRAETTVGGNSGTVRAFSGVDGSVLWRLDGDEPGIQFGISLSCLDDLDGDGAADLAVGAWGDSEVGPSAGAVYFVSGADGSQIRKVLGDFEDDHLGLSLLTVEDQDGDGIRDVLMGAPEAFSVDGIETGTIRLVSSATGAQLAVYAGSETEERLGQALGMLSDVNGDGIREWGLAAPFFGNGVGRVYVHDGVSGERIGVLTGPPTLGLFGFAIGAFTDLDGNGFDEFMIGSVFEANGLQPAGAMRIFSPNPVALLTAGEPTTELLEAGQLYLDDGGFLRGLVNPAWAGSSYELRLVTGDQLEVLGSGEIPPGGSLSWPLPPGFESASELLDSLEVGAVFQLEIQGAMTLRSNALTRDSR